MKRPKPEVVCITTWSISICATELKILNTQTHERRVWINPRPWPNKVSSCLRKWKRFFNVCFKDFCLLFWAESLRQGRKVLLTLWHDLISASQIFSKTFESVVLGNTDQHFLKYDRQIKSWGFYLVVFRLHVLHNNIVMKVNLLHNIYSYIYSILLGCSSCTIIAEMPCVSQTDVTQSHMNIKESSLTLIDIHEVSGWASCPASLTRVLPHSLLNINEQLQSSRGGLVITRRLTAADLRPPSAYRCITVLWCSVWEAWIVHTFTRWWVQTLFSVTEATSTESSVCDRKTPAASRRCDSIL